MLDEEKNSSVIKVAKIFALETDIFIQICQKEKMLTVSLQPLKKFLELNAVKKLSSQEGVKIIFTSGDKRTKAFRADLIQQFYPSKVTENPNEKNTQTEIGFKKNINMRHEGMKFMGERIINFEAKRIQSDFELCCIADGNVYPKTIKGIVETILENLYAVQSEEYPHYERRSVHRVTLDSEEVPKNNQQATMTDQITQYGEENPDEDFLKGMIEMAKKILDSESARLKHSEWFGYDMFEVRKDKKFKNWKSTTPSKLVDELNEKLYQMRYLKMDLDGEKKYPWG